MTSLKQIQTNRRNALCSTGPRTSEGKAAASQNAMRHGLRAENAVIAGEDPQEFVSFRRLLLDDLAPEGALEVFLADCIVAGFWKLRRAGRIETQLFGQMKDVPDVQAAGRSDVDRLFQVSFQKTYECPVHNRIMQEAPPTGCASCPLTVETGQGSPDAQEDSAPLVDPFDQPDDALDGNSPDDICTETESPTPLALGRIFRHDMTSSNILMRFRLYDSQIEGSLYKALTELQKLQILRARMWQARQAETDTLGGNIL